MSQKGIRTLKMFKIVEVVDLEPIVVKNPDAPSFQFRVEILKERKPRGMFHARVYRNETFRIQPTFPQENGNPKQEISDEHMFVEDVGEDWEKLKGKTADEVLKKVIKKIRDTFDL